MCINCPDMVTDCWEPGCLGPEFLSDGRRNLYSRSSKFYLDDTLCAHLQQRYGVTTGRALREFLRSRPDDEEPGDLEAYLAGAGPQFRAAWQRAEWIDARWWRRTLSARAPRLLGLPSPPL
jgi:hypothetical protein